MKILSKILGNENGNAVILIGAAFSIAFGSMILSYQNFLAFRARTKARTQEAYRLINALEAAAKIVRDRYDTSTWNSAAVPLCPPGSPPCIDPALAGGNGFTPSTSCVAQCTALYKMAPQICVDNPDHPLPYCFYGTRPVHASRDRNEIRLRLEVPDEDFPEVTASDRAFAWLERKFGGGGNPSRLLNPENLLPSAMAASPPPVANRMDPTSAASAPICADPSGASPFQAGCQVCGNLYTPGVLPDPIQQKQANLQCVTLYACPRNFKGCANYDPAIDPPSKAMVYQTLLMIPSTYQQ